MMILLAAAMPSWRYVMRNDAEEELLSRGGRDRRRDRPLPAPQRQRAAAVAGGAGAAALPAPRLQGPDDEARPLAPAAPGRRRAARRPRASRGRARGPAATTRRPRPRPPRRGRRPSRSRARRSGGFQGVASTSTEKSLRVFNGRTKYNEWLFVAGQPRVVGRQARRRAAPRQRPAGRHAARATATRRSAGRTRADTRTEAGRGLDVRAARPLAWRRLRRRLRLRWGAAGAVGPPGTPGGSGGKVCGV